MANQKNNDTCVICLIKGKDVKIKTGDSFLVALEKPYMNLYAHKQCFKELSYAELLHILQENTKIWYN